MVGAQPGSSTEDVAQLQLSMQYLMRSPVALLTLGDKSAIVNFNNNNYDHWDGLAQRLDWDPRSALQVKAADGTWGIQSPAMGLLHELAHKLLGFDEDQATAFETQVARDLGEPVRKTYEDTGAVAFVRVENSTQHTDNGLWVAYDKNGVKWGISVYSGTVGEINAPYGGTGTGNYGSGGSGGGGSSGGGGPYEPPKTTEPYEGGDEGSVPCPTCYVVGHSTPASPLPGSGSPVPLVTPKAVLDLSALHAALGELVTAPSSSAVASIYHADGGVTIIGTTGAFNGAHDLHGAI